MHPWAPKDTFSELFPSQTKMSLELIHPCSKQYNLDLSNEAGARKISFSPLGIQGWAKSFEALTHTNSESPCPQKHWEKKVFWEPKETHGQVWMMSRVLQLIYLLCLRGA
jgi:hypothetical protein